ncbi:hypothetical protein CY34DRAFT_814415 [Suillus luteus UH-Slu-Lm8-n1]|uniref:Unplaced genomic scaffold CY34scaffold_1241, whole genome shotgun sequence n=1 Tax=Suillus luteus UH-Slu-Lm8-n1 TaxID=930992 RepID=A0A0D0AJM4_9AGAM|nr:hypothetical protein CY34DRAFT_814415 [Suillus luteus UH-Slu-Lm8-n1]
MPSERTMIVMAEQMKLKTLTPMFMTILQEIDLTLMSNAGKRCDASLTSAMNNTHVFS